MADYAYLTDENLLEVVPGDADLRVPEALHKRYVLAKGKLAAVEAELRARAEKPLVVSPDQEEAMRAAARPGTWIVVREPIVRPGENIAEDTIPRLLVEALGHELNEAAPPPPEPEGPPKRPPLGRCPSRGNMPHTVMRYVQTDTGSVYFPGRKRIDGLCQCGLRIADVKCPHMKQTLVGQVPTCAWCGHRIIAQAGNIDNRDANGAPDPKIPTLIPIGAAGDDPAVRTAFRVESEQ